MQTKIQKTAAAHALPVLRSVADILSPSATRSTGKGKRIAFYSHDTLGLGHLRRTLKIARAVTTLFPEISALIISGSPDVGLVTNQLTSAGACSGAIDVVKLPSVKKLNNEEYTARFLPDDINRIVSMRSEIILGLLKTFEPHLLLVDHAPVGMRGELLPAFEWLSQECGSTKLVYGMRDIIDNQKTIRSNWSSNNIYSILQNTYDTILIYGDPRLTPTAEHYALPSATLAKTQYCGFIGDNDWRAKAPSNVSPTEPQDKPKKVVVTIGGGDYYGPEIVGAYLEMLRENLARIDFESVVITGPLLKAELYHKYERMAEGLPVAIHSSVEQLPELLCSSDALITTAGYNSAVDALSYAKRALMAPRRSMRKEQILRADALAEIEAVLTFDPHQTTTEELYNLVTRLLHQSSAPLQKLRADGAVDLDGSLRAAAICGEIMALKA